jgi:hypothetical protein
MLDGVEPMAHKKTSASKSYRESTDAEMNAAAARGRLEMQRDGARSVHYDESRDELRIALNSGVTMSIPRARIPGLEKATRKELEQVELSPMTTTISFLRLDADYSVQGLIRQALGLNEQQRAAGSVASPAKRAAAIQNGQLGGRPRKAVNVQSVQPKRKRKKAPAGR